MPNVIVPVGLHLGPVYPIVDKPDKNALPEYCEVLFKRDLEELTPSEFVVWGSAFGDAKRATRFEMNRETLADEVPRKVRNEIDVASVVDGLVKSGLLLEYDTDAGLAEDLLRKLQIYPTAQGLGNDAADPGWFRIGNRGDTLIKVTSTVYGLWSFASCEPSIWDACVKLQGGRAELDDGDEPLDVSVAEVAAAISNNIPLLVSAGCAYLDWLG